jgi:hypothetical protein
MSERGERYAARTDVTPDRSRSEIERALVKYGATGFAYMWEGENQAIAFKIHDRHIRIILPLPSLADFQYTATKQRRSASGQKAAYDQAVRQRWRALVLIVKAKLEAIEGGISTIEREFMADVVMPNNQTIGQWLQPQIESAYTTGRMPPLLPGASE